MASTVVIEEKRSVIEKFRNWYKEKYIDTGKAKEFEEKFDKGIETTKNVVYVVGGIATVALAILPADGPFGELIALAATPAFAKAVEAGGNILKDVVIGTKRSIEDNIVHEDGKSNVHIAANKEELLQHATDAMISGTNLKDTAYGIHNSANPQNDDVIDADYEIINEEENSYGMGR